MLDRRSFLKACAATPVALAYGVAATTRVRSARSGPWSSVATWEGGVLPPPGSSVEIALGHDVLYDIETEKPIRMVHVRGALRFAPDKNTRLDVGLLKVGGDATEDGASANHQHMGERATLEIGTPDRPIEAAHKAHIRLAYFEGFDRDSLPSLISCGARMHIHGAPMSRTWLKLGGLWIRRIE